MAALTESDDSGAIAAKRSIVDFDSIVGEESVGRGDILAFEVGDTHGPMTVTRIIPEVLLSDEPGARPVTVYQARGQAGQNLRLPIGAIFIDKMTALAVAPGDTIFVRRNADILKERGRGKGRPMRDYSVKVVERAAR